ncbi:MAG: methyltransferase regulatory domain-containing protein [Alphaproteobacteria bacterium]|nr:methyltransferase regulatory domain-containing protein [Alphaproteobacteria bacterium]
MTDPYADMPYPDALHEGTHLDGLAARARLHGVDAPDPETARVLAIGTARGANLLALAAAFPKATFVGVDLSEAQVGEADAMRRELGLSNIRFVAADLTTIDASWGDFDYIIAHGVFSWVPPEVADALLGLSARLTATGVMYVSYNVFPGWSDRIVIRELLLRHTASIEAPRDRIAQARELLRFLASQKPRAAWAHDLDAIVAEFDEHEDGYLFHEWLETFNHPLWFEDFVARAAAAGLAYLTDVQLPRSLPANYGPDVESVLEPLGPVGAGRYLDFLGDRRFRQSLLVRAEVKPDRTFDPERMRAFRFSARFTASGPPPADGAWELQSPSGGFSAGTPTSKLALLHLLRVCPERPSFDEILGALPEAQRDPIDLVQTLLACVMRDWVGLHVWKSPISASAGARPRVWGLARQLADRESVPSLLHQNVRIGALGRLFLRELDGRTTVPELAARLVALEESGSLQVGWPGARPSDHDGRLRVLTDLVQDRVDSLARLGLLVASR